MLKTVSGMEVLEEAKVLHRASVSKTIQLFLRVKVTWAGLPNTVLLLGHTDLPEACTQRWNQEINRLKEVIITVVAALTTMGVEGMVHTKRVTSMVTLDLFLRTLLLGVQLHLGALTTSRMDLNITTDHTEVGTILLTVG